MAGKELYNKNSAVAKLLLIVWCIMCSINVWSQIVVSRSYGVAPLGVHFTHNSAITNWENAVNNDFEWFFPDGEQEVGYQTIHTLSVSGWVKLRTTTLAGVVSTDSVWIEVIHPNNKYAGNKTTCLSSSSDFTGCPSGALQQSISNINNFNFNQNNHRFLLRSADTFQISQLRVLGNNSVLSSFGDNTEYPVIKIMGAGDWTVWQLGDSSAVEHISFIGNNWASGSWGSGNLFNVSNHVTIHDVNAEQINDFLTQPDGTGLKKGVVISHINAQRLGNYFWYSGPRPSFHSSGLKDVSISTIKVQHACRFNGGDWLTLQRVASDSIERSHIALREAKNVLVSECRLTGKGLYKIAMRNVSDDSSLTDTVSHVLIERNKISSNENELGIDASIGNWITIRNNLFLNAPININTNMSNFGVGPVSIYNNSIYINNPSYFSAVNLKQTASGSFSSNVVYVENCSDGPPNFCLEENPFNAASSQDTAKWRVDNNCYYVSGNPSGNIKFKGSLNFTQWQQLGFDANSACGNMSFAQASNNISVADFTPLQGTLPVNRSPLLTQRDITKHWRGYIQTDAGAYESDPINTIERSTASANIRVYPNPASDVLEVYVGAEPIKSSAWVIAEWSGRKVANGIFNESSSLISVSSLQSGLYLLIVYTKTYLLYTSVMVQR